MIFETLVTFLSPLLDHWGSWVILITAILEATPVFGLVMPGQTVVMLGGFFSRLGEIPLWKVIIAAAIGAIIGDYLGYILGRKYGHSFLTKYGKYFLFKEVYYQKTRELMKNHSGKAILFGRFNPITRAFAPLVAGASEVKFFKFSLFNILGGVSWALIFAVIGYIFGESYNLASKYFERSLIIVLALILLIAWLNYKRKKVKYSIP